MRKWMETVFICCYLCGLLLHGVHLLYVSGGRPLAVLFGCMALVLGTGDLFHLAPRVYQLWRGIRPAGALALGNFLTSVTATVYYVLLYYVWVCLSGRQSPVLTAIVWGLLALRLLLCCLPQNRWRDGGGAGFWRLLRNLPFVALGGVVAALFLHLPEPARAFFRLLPPAVLLSFCCYLPVALLAHKKPLLGLLMLPKTVLYLWIQFMGFIAFSQL